MYISIGRLEIYYNKLWTFGRCHAFCGCFIFDLGPIGFTWLSKYCNDKSKEDN